MAFRTQNSCLIQSGSEVPAYDNPEKLYSFIPKDPVNVPTSRPNVMQTDLPMVSIITVNYNSEVITGELIQSILSNCRYPNYELIVVDNDSARDPTELIHSISKNVNVIKSSRNLGFSGGNNLGIKAARGEYYFLVNNDTEFTPGLVEELLTVFQTYSDAGLVSPMLQSYFDKGTIEYAGYEKVNPFTGRNAMIGCREKDLGQYNKLISTHYAHGGAMMVSKKVIEKAGLMPEDFFLYYEELDWSERIKEKGFKIYYQPGALIYHKESMTTGKSSPLKTYYLTRNRILFMRRNASFISKISFFLYLICFTIPKNSVMFIVNGKKEHLKSFWRGILWHLQHPLLKKV